ncbi:MAG TPA: DNA-processing protein DprA [Clostridia bacterium]|nr:DNA-processing protein DprA [Clostridia bacterium]
MLGVGVPGPVPAERPAPGAGRRDRSAERDAWTVLAAVRGLGPVGLAALLARYGSGRAILEEAAAPGGIERLAGTEREPGVEGGAHRRPVNPALAMAIADAADDAELTLAGIRAAGIEVVTVEEPPYPHRLAAIELPPHLLFVRGDLHALDPARAVAVVGTRRPTFAGRRRAARIADAIARRGATVVSGLALGIDGEVHEATIRAGTPTIAVIGSGHERLFPREHADLAERIVRAGGGVVSELAPGVEANAGTFPRRNRVISGMSDATVVVEAPARSGALITASWALEQGRECFLVPGAPDDPSCAGCLSFLREYPGSARVVAGIPQLLDDLELIDHDAPDAVSATPAAEATLVDLGGTAERIGRQLVAGLTTVDELVAVTGLPVATVLGALTLLEGRGLAADNYGRYRPIGALALMDPGRPARRRRAAT